TRQTAGLHGFTFAARNGGTKAHSVAFYGTCVTVVRPPGAPRQRLRIKIDTNTTPIHPGSQVVKQSCPRGWSAPAVGFAVPAGLTMDGAAAVRSGGRWSVTSSSDAPALADLQLVCGRLAST